VRSPDHTPAASAEARLLIALIAAYGVIVCSLLGKLPLWTDEVQQLLATRGYTLAQTLQRVPENPGGSPLGYFVQNLALRAPGYSVFSARLPAALFGILGCAAMAWLARELRLRRPAVSVLLFMALPLQFRYALEGRPYSQILFLGALLTALLLRLTRAASPGWTAAYGVTVLAGVYSSPLVGLVAAAHGLWAWLLLKGDGSRRVQIAVTAAMAGAVLLYLPWYLFARAAWRQTILDARWHFVWTAKTPLMLIRELSGGGYWVSAPLLAAGAAGLLSDRLSRPVKALLVLIFVVPVAGALAADAAFDYFLAVRQWIHALPGLVLLAAEGLHVLEDRRRLAGITALLAVLGASLIHDVKWFSRPRENWQLAATLLKSRAGGSCLVYLPEHTAALYRFFEPGLPAKSCNLEAELSQQRGVTVALSPYALPDQVKRAFDLLRQSGFSRVESTAAGGMLILGYAAGATSNTDGRQAR
jgi:uncharacterized membrane protein